MLKEEFGGAGNALVVSFQGLTVEKDWELRRALEKAELNYRVVKNTLGKLAVEGTPLEPLKDHFIGMTAIAYSEKDPVGLAKVLSPSMAFRWNSNPRSSPASISSTAASTRAAPGGGAGSNGTWLHTAPPSAVV